MDEKANEVLDEMVVDEQPSKEMLLMKTLAAMVEGMSNGDMSFYVDSEGGKSVVVFGPSVRVSRNVSVHVNSREGIVLIRTRQPSEIAPQPRDLQGE